MTEKYGPDKSYIPLKKEEILTALKDDVYSLYIYPEEERKAAEASGKPVLFFCKNKSLSEENQSIYLFQYQNAIEMEKRIDTAYELQAMYHIDRKRAVKSKMITYFSLGGGMGSSVVAMGTAAHFAKMNKKILYLNLKPFAAGYFSAENEGVSLEMLTEDIEGKKGNLNHLLDSMALDSSGVFLLNHNGDLNRLNQMPSNEFETLFQLLDQTEKFEWMIMDVQMTSADYLQAVLKHSSIICIVLDGSSDSMKRFAKMTAYLNKVDSQYMDKIKIIYNKYRTMPNVGKEIQSKVAGGIGYIESGSPQDVLNKVANMKFLDNLF